MHQKDEALIPMYYRSFDPSLQAELESRVARGEDPTYQATADSFEPLTRADYVAMALLGAVIPLMLVAAVLVSM
jgi:hypothetical protein